MKNEPKSVRIDRALVRKLKVLSAKQGISIKEIIETKLKELFK